MEQRIELDEKFYFSKQEMERRWEAIRYGMALRGIDALLIYGEEMWTEGEIAHLRYVTGAANRGWCIFPMKDDPVLFMGNYNKHYPSNYFLEVYPLLRNVKSLDEERGGGLSGVIQTVKDLGFEKGRIGLVDGNERAETSMPFKIYQRILRTLPAAEFSDQTSLLTELRLIKSEEEIAKLETAGKLAKLMIDVLIQSVRKGVRECEIYSNMVKTQINNGGDSKPFIRLDSGSTLSKTVHLCHGKTPPYAPKQRSLQLGDMVITEFHASYGGYLAHAEMTVFLGKPPEELARVHSIACQSLQRGFEAMQVGKPFDEVIQECRRPVTEAGMKWLECGLHQHSLSTGGYPGGRFGLQPNMVFGQNADIYDSRWLPNVGVQMADTVVVGVNSPRRLCNTPLELLVR